MGNLSEALPNKNLLLDLTPNEVDLIRSSLRNEEERHKMSGFRGLTVACHDLRNKINDATIELAMNNKLSTVL